MKTKNLIFIILLFTGFYSSAQNVDISGFARTYEGITVDSGKFAIVQQTLNLNFEKEEKR